MRLNSFNGGGELTLQVLLIPWISFHSRDAFTFNARTFTFTNRTVTFTTFLVLFVYVLNNFLDLLKETNVRLRVGVWALVLLVVLLVMEGVGV